ncbi:MAG: protein translocase subunit SecD [Eubacteriales bacterium]|nr:protein translocase subunit SecD [Eubacteriales bacterium]MDY3332819.1 protein translocase subunit SecD [Gallibacter sp.]
MKEISKKITVVLLIITLCLGWFGMIAGFGKTGPLVKKIPLGLDIEGGVYVVLEAKTNLQGEKLRQVMNQTKEVINKRVDSIGVSNADVRVEGTKRIRVELPGAKNAEDVIRQIGRTAQLQFILADGTPVLDGGEVKNADISQGKKGGYVVNLEFKADGAKAFEEATKKALSGTIKSTADLSGKAISGKSIIILLDNQIISAPEVNEVISGGKCEISGNFDKNGATELAALIRGGALPVPLEEVTSSVQSAKVGFEALDNSIVAGLIGVALIFLIMLIGYRLMGLIANVALAIYILLILIIMGIMGSVLTLPGIAGLILSIGMAVDANVIIFTRIKEEIIAGKSIRTAVHYGYKKAVSTVFDSQITTLIAAVILYQVGSSAVKGFAITLLIGILVGLLTAVAITQLFLQFAIGFKGLNKKSLFCIKEDNTPTFQLKKQFSFIKNRKIYYIISIAILVVGIGFSAIRGFNYGIDFTGGTMIQIDMGKKVETAAVEKVFSDEGIKAEVVYSGQKQEEVIIRTVKALDNDDRKEIINKLQDKFKLEDKDIMAQELFGPTIGKELKSNAIQAILLATLGILIYVRLRFREWMFGLSAILGILHDVLIVVSFYAIFGITVNNPFIAGVLTVVGYSINDTIVIFDRIRENSIILAKNTDEIIDISVNQTLSRSIMTSFTTLIVMVPLFIMASSSMREFILPLMVGVATGCMSSIFICSPIYYDLSKKRRESKYKSQIAKKKKKNKYVGAKKKEKLEV